VIIAEASEQFGGGIVHKPTEKQIELGRVIKGRMERRTTKRWS
jgi:hypothetical protein